MTRGFLPGRVLLKFGRDSEAEEVFDDLSAVTFDLHGCLWLASDELVSGQNILCSLVPKQADTFGGHQFYPLQTFISLPDTSDKESEADLESLCFAGGYLWFTGSHSSRRPRQDSENANENLERLATVDIQPNRYLLGRVPLEGGSPVPMAADPIHPGKTLTAARLAEGKGGNVLIEALLDDEHFGPFLRTVHEKDGRKKVLPLPSKDNGFDIEGLAVLDNRQFLGLRGPVLLGWACLLEIECVEQGDGLLGLAPIGDKGRLYRKHFVDLGGLGVRDLAVDGADLLILAGPTMVLDGPSRLFRLSGPDTLGHDSSSHDSITSQKHGLLWSLFDLPFGSGGDHPEGVGLTSWHDEPAVLIVYDSPLSDRLPKQGRAYADVFRLPQ